MNVLMVIDSLGSGGAQRQMVLLAKGLVARGHAVTLLNYYPEFDHFRDDLAASGVLVIDARKSSRWSLSPVVAIRRTVKQGNFDVALSFLTTPNLYLVLACRIFWQLPVVVSERYTFSSSKLSLSTRLAYLIYRRASMLTTNSHHQREAVARHFPTLKNRLMTIYNGVDTERFAPDEKQIDNGDQLVLVAVGSVASKKNSLGLARALEVCRSRGLDVVIRWVGIQRTSSEGTHPFEQTNAFLESSGMSKYWQWLGEQPEVERFIKEADAVIHPSFFEGLPNVVCEALACGKIVLASDVGDHAELLGDGKRGFCFVPEDPASIASTIERLSRLSIDERRSLETASREYAVTRLSVNRYICEYESLLAECVERETRGKQ